MTRQERREKWFSAGATALVMGLIGAALVRGLGVQPVARIEEALALVTVPAEPPPPPPRRPPPQHLAPARKAPAPPAPRGQAAPLVALKPPIPVLQPPPVAVAQKPGLGADRATGAADDGAGQGAGGRGDGSGGGDGDGDGGIPPRQTGGRLRYSDLPPERRAVGIGGSVGVRYSVETDGRVGVCDVTRTSGYADMDALTCRLIQARFRFRPSRDPDGRPVRSFIVENHSWIVEREPDDPDATPR